MKKHKVVVLGGGFAGLTAAAVLAAKGKEVVLFEKNSTTGGRSRTFEQDGFVFDMGPSWYWMPDVFERYYNLFGHSTSEFYELKKLDPGFRIVYGQDDVMDVPADFSELCDLFDKVEPGAATSLRKFMEEAEYKYRVGIHNLVYKPGLSLTEFLNFELLKGVFRLQVFSSFSKHVRTHFSHPQLIALMEFPVLFLGAMPRDTPALYSLMNYAGLKQGTFYPMGGFGKVADAFKTIAQRQGVTIHTSAPVQQLDVRSGSICSVQANGHSMDVDAVLGSADYHHIEQKLLSAPYRSYSEAYWSKKTFAPSCLLFYLGVNKKIDRLLHHNLFFDTDMDRHARAIYTDKQWPKDPLFYVCCPSKTDPSVAPEGKENLFVLMPVATGLSDPDEIRGYYYDLLMQRLEDYTGCKIRDHVLFKKSYSVSDFRQDYNAYGGNAYGLANTLFQTAVFKPRIRSNKVKNLFFAGQLTVPGPGVPPSIISGQVGANELYNFLNR